jgi:hypothetical protein
MLWYAVSDCPKCKQYMALRTILHEFPLVAPLVVHRLHRVMFWDDAVERITDRIWLIELL